MIFLATVTGAFVIMNTSIAARLSQKTETRFSLVINYIFGLAASLLILLLAHKPIAMHPASLPLWAWTGGLLGVAVILASNRILPKIRAFEMTILLFAGQLIAGVLFDLYAGITISPRLLAGICILIIGLMIFSGYFQRSKESQNTYSKS